MIFILFIILAIAIIAPFTPMAVDKLRDGKLDNRF